MNVIPKGNIFEDFILEFEIEYTRKPPGENPHTCVFFRRQDSKNFYFICFSHAGNYKFARTLDGKYEEIVGWNSGGPLRVGNEINLIKIIANNESYIFEANGREIDRFEDGFFMEPGEIVIGIYAHYESKLLAEIDNLVITEYK